MNKQMGKLLVQLLGIKIVLLLIVILSIASCTPYGKGCDGNRKMLTAGAGHTKFRR